MIDQEPFLEERMLELVPHLRPPFDVGFWSTSLNSVVRALWMDNTALLASSAQFKRFFLPCSAWHARLLLTRIFSDTWRHG